MHAVQRSLNLRHFGNVLRQQKGALGRLDCNTFYTYSPEPSQPLNREPTFCSVEDAVKCVKSGKNKCQNAIVSTKNTHTMMASDLIAYAS